MPITIDVRSTADSAFSPAERDSTIADCMAWFHQVDNWFSTYKYDSAINRLWRRETRLSDCPAVIGEVLDRCEELRRESDGYFDVFAAGRLDPSGLVKGWAVMRASALLDAAGLHHHCVNAGGDMTVSGDAEPNRSWRIGIEHPLFPRALCAIVSATDAAVATSGTSARGAHVINPRTGRPATELASVTVIGGDLATADAYATAALAMGMESRDWLESRPDYDALIIDRFGCTWETEGFVRYRIDSSNGATNHSS